ncbi:hypothetical protein NDU88_005130 [Pleurodeles waltl]|uniref:Uncharacterized protein n=1 Tax=Pleurodeles waltl TaxID=8319 RepID=A0AAV7UIN8_PLEWA|nr:hypothetical protein NDU88_005130 [Pleurodeles waltl]
MCEGFSPTKTDGGDSAGATGWPRATLELQRSCQAASHVALRGNAGRVSTRQVAEQVATCKAGVEQDDPGRRASAGTSRHLSSSKVVFQTKVFFGPAKDLVVEWCHRGDRERKEGKVFFGPAKDLVVELHRRGNRERKESKIPDARAFPFLLRGAPGVSGCLEATIVGSRVFQRPAT